MKPDSLNNAHSFGHNPLSLSVGWFVHSRKTELIPLFYIFTELLASCCTLLNSAVHREECRRRRSSRYSGSIPIPVVALPGITEIRCGLACGGGRLCLLCGTGKLYNRPGIVCYNTVVACGLVKPCTWLLGVVLNARKEIFCRNFMIFEGMPSRLQIWTIQDSNCSVWCQFFSVL